MSQECSSIWTRWMHNACYCPTGSYYPDNAFQGERLVAERLADLDPVHDLCTVRGLDIWKGNYLMYLIPVYIYFLCVVGWCLRQLPRLRRTVPRVHLFRAIYGFCLASALIRVCYLTAQGALVHGRQNSTRIAAEKFVDVSYTPLFAASASAFLCICQHWLHLIHIMEDVIECEWYRNPAYVACAAILGLDLVYDCISLFGSHPVLDGIYFLWLSLTSVMIAIIGVCIARRLYEHLSLWLDVLRPLYGKIIFSSLSISVLTTGFLVEAIVQALYARFYAWPNFICWVIGRFFEAAYLTMLLRAIGPASVVRANGSFLQGLGGSIESDASLNSMTPTCRSPPTRMERFWIASASNDITTTNSFRSNASFASR